MRRLLRASGILLLVVTVLYVGAFVVMVKQGRRYAEHDGLLSAYYLADPYSVGGIDRHYQRARFFAPLVHVTQRWTGGTYLVFPDTFGP